MRLAALSLLLLPPLPAHATYMSECTIEGVVLGTPVLVLPEGADPQGPGFAFRVTASTPPTNGARNDAECSTLVDDVLDVTLPPDSPMPVQGDRLTLTVIEFDDADIPRTRIFTLAPP